ncbi:hypothetical protein BGW80DRAFT_1251280 [Lactifluus volemus]|nr:hypothetical protein BGW80DRAFT_1251280 [Lactifluus volemus]
MAGAAQWRGPAHAIARVTGVRGSDGRNSDARATVTPIDCLRVGAGTSLEGDAGGEKETKKAAAPEGGATEESEDARRETGRWRRQRRRERREGKDRGGGKREYGHGDTGRGSGSQGKRES